MLDKIPNPGQVALLLAAAVLLAVAAVVSIARARLARPQWRFAAFACGWGGIGVGLLVLLWHAVGRDNWLPLEDNFDALAWLGLMLAACVLYVQSTRPVAGLDWFVLPVSVFLLVGAAVFGRTEHRQYRQSVWTAVHLITTLGGSLALAIAGAVGAMYLVQNRRLRAKRAHAGSPLGSLERLEMVAQIALTLGWPLFTIGMILGLIRAMNLRTHGGGMNEIVNPKVLLALGAWGAYSLALFTPMNPSFRGRKAAVLSLVGFVLLAGTLIAIQYRPGEH